MTRSDSIGVDLHHHVIQICVLDEQGERVAEERIRYCSLERDGRRSRSCDDSFPRAASRWKPSDSIAGL